MSPVILGLSSAVGVPTPPGWNRRRHALPDTAGEVLALGTGPGRLCPGRTREDRS